MDKRAEFVKQWHERSLNCVDNFERFIFLYFCFIVMIKAWAANNSKLQTSDSQSDDGKFVDEYFKKRDENDNVSIIELCEPLANFKKLVKRKGRDSNYILDTDNSIDQKLFTELYHYYNYPTRILTSQRRSIAIGKVLKTIRNNLFHGGKLYEDTGDSELVNLTVPILEKLLIHGAKNELHLKLKDVGN